jgi:hypothetical protein
MTVWQKGVEQGNLDLLQKLWERPEDIPTIKEINNYFLAQIIYENHVSYSSKGRQT